LELKLITQGQRITGGLQERVNRERNLQVLRLEQAVPSVWDEFGHIGPGKTRFTIQLTGGSDRQNLLVLAHELGVPEDLKLEQPLSCFAATCWLLGPHAKDDVDILLACKENTLIFEIKIPDDYEDPSPLRRGPLPFRQASHPALSHPASDPPAPAGIKASAPGLPYSSAASAGPNEPQPGISWFRRFRFEIGRYHAAPPIILAAGAFSGMACSALSLAPLWLGFAVGSAAAFFGLSLVYGKASS